MDSYEKFSNVNLWFEPPDAKKNKEERRYQAVISINQSGCKRSHSTKTVPFSRAVKSNPKEMQQGIEMFIAIIGG